VQGYVDQRLSDLRLIMMDRAPNRDRFRLYGETQVRTDAYTADMWIIGSSHVMTFATARGVGSEMLTCRGDGCPDDDQHVMRDLSGARFTRPIPGADSYVIGVETQTFDAASLRDEQRRLVSEADDDCLLHLFPAPDPDELSPLTLVRVVNADASVFEMTTAHTYPQDLAMVFTHTTIRLT